MSAHNEIVQSLIPVLVTIPDLTPEMRSEARRKAKDAIASEYTPPRREDYADVRPSKYPPIIVKNTAIALVVLFITSFIPSALHIYTAVVGKIETNMLINWQLVIIGICTVIGAELAIIVLVVGSQVFFADNQKMQKRFYVPIALALGIAYIGNFTAVEIARPFDFLLAVAPPTFVLFVSFIGKALIIDYVQTRYSGEQDYQDALEEYRRQTANPELAPNFLDVYYRQLKVMIERVIVTGAGASERKRVIGNLTGEEKQVLYMMLVNRTMQNEKVEYYQIDLPKGALQSTSAISGRALGSGDGVQRAVHPINLLDNSDNPSILDKMDRMDKKNIPRKRSSPQTMKVIRYFKDNPSHIDNSSYALEPIIGVGKSTINAVQVAIRNGEISLTAD